MRTEEFYPLGPDETVRWDDGTRSTTWAEDTVATDGTEVLARYADGPTVGAPPSPAARWDGARPGTCRPNRTPLGLARVMSRVLREAGAAPAVPLPAEHPAVQAGEVDVVRRSSPTGSWLFAINHATPTSNCR